MTSKRSPASTGAVPGITIRSTTPATGAVIQTLSIPRGQAAMAVGQATADARSFRLEAVRGSETNGIVSNPFLEYAFRTERYTITVTIHDDGTWSYEQETLLVIPGQAEPFRHTDRNTLHKIGEPTPNPTAQAADGIAPQHQPPFGVK